MPAIMIGAGIATGGLTTLASGAMIAGGAMSAVGAVTGSKDLQQAGNLIGLAGGIGTAAKYAGASGTTGLLGEGAVAPSMADPVLEAGTSQAWAPAAGDITFGEVAGQASSNAPALAQLKKYSLISGAIQGAGAAVGAYEQSAAAREIADQNRAYQTSLSNRANTVGAVPAIARKPGLLEMRPAVPQPVQPRL